MTFPGLGMASLRRRYPVPTIASLSPSVVNVAGGSITVTGTNFVPGSVVWHDGVARATSYVDSTHVTYTAPAGADGTSVAVVVANPGGALSNTEYLIYSGTDAPADLATLNLTSYYEQGRGAATDYDPANIETSDVDPWVGLPSAGPSAGRDLVAFGGPWHLPTVGGAIVPTTTASVDFDDDLDDLKGQVDAASLLSVSAFTIGFYVRIDSTTGALNTGSGTAGQCIFFSNYVNVQCGKDAGMGRVKVHTVNAFDNFALSDPFPLDTWVAIFVRFGGGNLDVRVNAANGPVTSSLANTASLAGKVPRVAHSINGCTLHKRASQFTANFRFSDAECAVAEAWWAHRFEEVAPPGPTDLDVVRFSGGHGFAASVSPAATKTVRLRLSVDEMPALPISGGLQIVAGTDTGVGGGGWLVTIENAMSGNGAVVPQLVIYAHVGSFKTIAKKYLMPADVGRTFTLHLAVTSGNDGVRAYLDGRCIGYQTASAAISAGTPLVIGSRNTGTLSSKITVHDCAIGTTALSTADVLADAIDDGPPAFAGQIHRYVATAGMTSTWADQVGAINLAAVGTGAPALVNEARTFMRLGTALQIYGDSIAAGRKSGGLLGDGWRRAVQRSVSAGGKAIALLGAHVPNGPDTLDYDPWFDAVGSEQLNVRLGTFAADLAAGHPDCAVLLAHGINDIALGRTANQLRADVTTACGMIQTARPGRPIFVCSVLPATGLSAPAEAEWTNYTTNFDSFIATLQATHPQVVGINYTSVVSNAADVAQLYDGVHPTPAIYAAMAAVIQPLIAGALP